MLRYTDPLAPTAPSLVVDLVSGFVVREQRGLPGSPPPSWHWKTTYALGVSLAERTVGVLGVRSPLTPELIDPIAGAFLASDRVAVPPAEPALIHAELGGRGPFVLRPRTSS